MVYVKLFHSVKGHTVCVAEHVIMCVCICHWAKCASKAVLRRHRSTYLGKIVFGVSVLQGPFLVWRKLRDE